MLKTFSFYQSGLFKNPVFVENFLDFCRSAYHQKDDPAHVNMWSEDWQSNYETLPYHIFSSGRLCSDTGETFILKDDDKIIAVSSIYVSPFDDNISIGGVRSWVIKEHRGEFMIGRHLLPLQLKWAKHKDQKAIVLTFNEYNRRLLNYFRRSGFGIKKKRNPDSLFYNGLHEVPFPINLQFTKQWAIYHKIDENYEPDWDLIKWVDSSK